MNQSRTVKTVMLGLFIAGLNMAQALEAPRVVNNGYPVLINEIMASNATTFQDPQGHFDDWIEFINKSDKPVDVGGMYLTDDLEDPTQWQFPTDNAAATIIAPHGHLILWLDGHGEAEGLHASFKLSAQGDELALFAPDGMTLVDQIDFGEQTPDMTLGRFPDGTQQWTFLATPTPGAENTKEFDGFVAPVRFSLERGFYAEPVSITLSTATEGATIRYTLDGMDPTSGSEGRYGQWMGTPYDGPIEITTTTCVRAVASRPGWRSSDISSHTFFFLADVARQPRRPEGFPNNWEAVTADYQMDPDIVNDLEYADRIVAALASLPSLSIVMNVEDMFGARGIYSNPSAGGANWERPASVELLYPDGTEGFQIDCGVRIQGGAFRNPNASRKHSFRLLFKGMYGSTKLRHPLFGPHAADEFDTITLRAGANDAYVWSSARGTEQYTRDQFIRDLQHDAGQASAHGMFVHLYVNGLYWGLFNPVERPDDAFSASYYGGEKEDWDVFRHKGFARNAGQQDALTQLRTDCVEAADSLEAYQRLQGNNPDGTVNPSYPHLLDIPNYIDYMIVNYWGGNWDWPWNNYWLGRKRTPDSTGFKFYCWDAEDVMGSPRSSLYINKVANPDSTDVGEFHAQLVRNPEYRLLFADRLHRLFFNDGILTPESLVDRYARMAEEVELAMITESARWGDQHHPSPVSPREWISMRDWILDTYLPQRSDIVLEQFRDTGLYPDLAAPVFSVQGTPRTGGHIASSERLTLSGTGSIWMTLDGTDPRIPGKSGVLESTVILEENAHKRVLVPEAEIDESWKGGQFFDDADWTASTGAVGYELGAGYEQYYTLDLFDRMFYTNASCYLRIPFDLSSDPSQWAELILRVRYDDGFVAYLNGVEVARDRAPDELSWNATATDAHDDSSAVTFTEFSITAYADALRIGENILAIHALNNQDASTDFLFSAEITGVDPVSLSNVGISPSAIQYGGPMMLTQSGPVRARVFQDGQWSAVTEAFYAVGPVVESLRISELMYHPVVDDTEFIELVNVGSEPINLNLVEFTEAVEFVFPWDVTLAPGETVLVVEDTVAFEDLYGPGLNVVGQYEGRLSNGGERITLADAVGTVIQSFQYDDNWYPSTDGGGSSLTVRAPQADPNGLSDKDSWRASTVYGGSPGR